jgi:flagellin
MAQVVNVNVPSLFAAMTLNRSAKGLQTSQERTSSTERINSVEDDPTGLKQASLYAAEMRGTEVAIRNAEDSVSKAKMLDGYAKQVNDNLLRLYEIFVQTNDEGNEESAALIAENARIAELTQGDDFADWYGSEVTVDGKGGTVAVQSEAIEEYSGESAEDVLADIEALTEQRAIFGADIATFNSAVSTMQTSLVNVTQSYSRIMSTDYAVETANQARYSIMQQAGMAVLAQANQNPQMVLTLLR